MRIKPIVYNYGMLVRDMPDMEVLPQRKNVVLRNSKYTMWGEHIDPENQIMMLTSIAVSRDYSKESRQTLLDEWDNYLHQYATDEQPEEIMAKINERQEKAKQRAAEAAKKAKEAESKAKAAMSEKESKSKKAV